MRSRRSFAYLLLIVSLVFAGWTSAVEARDFFHSYSAAPAEARVNFLSPFDQASVGDQPQTRIIVRPSIRRSIGQGTRAYCVRTCDGRFFPVTAGRGDESNKDFCKSACPAAETKVYSGSSIETAYSSDGKPYSKIASAFRYRNESIPGCFCQNDGRAGLSHIRIEDDKTIRVGDIVAKANGLTVASSVGRKGIIFARISAARMKAEKLPEVAAR